MSGAVLNNNNSSSNITNTKSNRNNNNDNKLYSSRVYKNTVILSSRTSWGGVYRDPVQKVVLL